VGPSIAERFWRLFAGAARSHGTYGTEETGSGPKKEIKKTARTLREPVTRELWEKHLDGSRPLGIVPIREDGTCMWGGVDVDVYDIDPADLVKVLLDARIPAFVCRTKSGGAHIYIFFKEPIPASVVIGRLRELAALIGHGSSEIFPKQEAVLIDRGDLGSWLNMPYYGGDKTNRYAVRADGRGMSVESFIEAAEGARLTQAQLEALVLRRRIDDFAAGPPCLEMLAGIGFPPGTRNNGLLNLGVLAKKMRPDGWEQLLEEWNQKYITPPLAAAEVSSCVRGLRRKDYNYRCRDQPIVSCCNVAICRTRPHGVGSGGEATLLESVSILETDPPVFFVVLKTGGTVEVSAGQLMSSHEFQLATLIQLRQVIPEYPRQTWTRSVQEIVESATTIEAPKESGIRGKFGEVLEQFLTDRHKAETKDEILLGKPWHDEEARLVYFRLRDLEQALDRAKFSTGERGGSLRTWMTSRIRELGGDTQQFWVKGKNINVWILKSDMFSWEQVRHDLRQHDESPL